MSDKHFRILHTADWHIGKTLLGLPLLDDQRHVLQQLLAHIEAHRPNVVVIAGDIYDRSVPAADAVQLLDETLTAIVQRLQTPVVLIAGNHDGPERLGFGAALLGGCGLTVRGPVDLRAAPVRLDAGGWWVSLCPMPYAEPTTVRAQAGVGEADPAAGGATVRDHAAALALQARHLLDQVPPGDRTVAIAHGFVQGGRVANNSGDEYSESERPLAVGGTAVIDPQAFEGFDYAALGHLHQPQWVAGSRRIRYSGSLLQYSFAEADQPRSASLVALSSDGSVDVTELSMVPVRPLRKIEGLLADLVEQGKRDPHRDDLVWATLTDAGVLLDPMGQLRQGYPNALHIARPQLEGGSGELLRGDHRQRQPIDVLGDFWVAVHGVPLPDPARVVAAPLVDKLIADARGAR